MPTPVRAALIVIGVLLLVLAMFSWTSLTLAYGDITAKLERRVDDVEAGVALGLVIDGEEVSRDDARQMLRAVDENRQRLSNDQLLELARRAVKADPDSADGGP